MGVFIKNQGVFILLLSLLISSVALASGPLSPPLEEARKSVLFLTEWKFQPDAEDRGQSLGWASLSFDDSGWPVLKAVSPWQEQGYPEHHGVGWYRAQIFVPLSWKNTKILFHSDGIRDEYDLYVNGRLLRHFGSREIPTSFVPTQIELRESVNFGRRNQIAIRVTEHDQQGGGIDKQILIRRTPPLAQYQNLLPAPVLASRPELVDLYWQSWRMAWEKISFGTKANSFVPAYMDEGYDGLIYQWDSIFMSFYGRYGRRLFPAMETLDNFYARQEANGYIQRIYSKTTGQKILEPGEGYTVTNPPLFAWAEWDYYQLTGDDSRLSRVFAVLQKYDAWLEAHQRSQLVPGMYWQTGFDSGMDNMPRPKARDAGWVDASLQQALVAKYLGLIANHLGDPAKAAFWADQFQERSSAIQRWAWSESDGFFYDVDRDQKHTGVKHIGALWSLLSGVASPSQAQRLVSHLKDPTEFYRPHLFPALSAADGGFTPQASYWAGGVWAPTNYMSIRGLVDYGYADFAHEAALNHLQSMAAVYAANLDSEHIDPNERDEDFHTIWECYNPDQFIPCTRADAFYFGRQDFAGWTALGPITLMIEQIIGLDIKGAENRVQWTLREAGRVGLERFEVRTGNLAGLIAEPAQNGIRLVKTRAQKSFSLFVKVENCQREFQVPAGTSEFRLNEACLSPLR